MALFGKKKRDDEITPESLGFGFPAAEKKKEDFEFAQESANEPVMPEPIPDVKTVTPRPVSEMPPQVMQQFSAIPIPEPRQQMQAPQMMQQPMQMPRMQPIEPALEPRPMVPTMPEDIRAPQAPAIQKLRPHVFLKVSKYKEVMTSIDRITNQIRDLRKSLKGMRDVEEKETLKLKESEELLMKLEEIAGVFDKIFSTPEK